MGSYIERNYGVCCAMEGNWTKAAEYWKAAVALDPVNSTAHYLVGCSDQVSGNYESGILNIQNSIALDPDFRSSYVGLSNCYLLSKEYDLALEACQACLRRFPDAVGAHFNMAQ